MYYSVEELSTAINKAKEIIDYKTKEHNGFVRSYNDCFALLVEYDKALRGKYSYYNDFMLNYDTGLGFHRAVKKAGFNNLEDLAIASNYEIIKNKKPMLGDIAFERPSRDGFGGAMLAGNDWWISVCENNGGITEKRPLFFFERKLSLLARPLRSEQ